MAWANSARPSQVAFLDEVVSIHHVQPPDLFALRPDGTFFFAEARGPTDRLSAKQKASHQLIEDTLKASVEILHIKIRKRPARAK